MKKRNQAKTIIYYSVILILVFLMLFSGLQILESTVFHTGQQQDGTIASQTIVVDGVEYYPKQDITVVMVLGIDQYGPVQDSGSYNNKGASDMVALLIFDETHKVCDMLYLNRDTMMDIPVLGLGGKDAGTIYAQLALAHTYGSGLDDSCLNVKKAIENFLHGVTIDYYVSMNMDAIATLNDAVGGVTVVVEDDFSMIDPTITMGEMTLNGQQAITFVRTRKGVGDQMNLTRIERQKQYMTNFLSALRAQDDLQHLLNTYEAVSPYMVTNCSLGTMQDFLERYADYPLNRILTPEGENTLGEQYIEFYVDEEKLEDLVIQLFYARK